MLNSYNNFKDDSNSGLPAIINACSYVPPLSTIRPENKQKETYIQKYSSDHVLFTPRTICNFI